MEKLSEKARKNVEELAKKLSNLKEGEEAMVTMLAQAYADGVKAGAGIGRKSA